MGIEDNLTDESSGKVDVGRLNTGGYNIRDSMTLQKSVTRTKPQVKS